MTYSSQLAAISRTPITLVVLTMDYCALTFGVGACAATGRQCYNTYPTCKYKTAYDLTTIDYKFTSANAPIAFRTGERPYINTITYMPTEIGTSITVTGRVVVTFHDDADPDVGLDPYWSSRATTPERASFWKRFHARNRNFKGRLVRVYEGFHGLAEGDFSQKWVGRIDNLSVGVDGSCRIECIDLIKSMQDISIPTKSTRKLVSDVTSSQTSMVMYTPYQVLIDSLTAPGYVRIEDEVIYFTTFTAAQNEISGCTRGALGTTAVEHDKDKTVQDCKYYGLDYPFTHLQTILSADAGFAAGYIDSTAFSYWDDFPDADAKMELLVSEPTSLEKLYFQLLEILDCRSWVGEDLKITISRNVPNEPGRAYTTITDAENIAENSIRLDGNEKSRITRVVVYWEPTVIGKPTEKSTYSRVDVAVDAEAESDNEYGDTIEKIIYCPWATTRNLDYETIAYYIRNQAARILFRYRDAEPLLDFEVELKDMDLKTGEFAWLTTDAVLDRFGDGVSGPMMIIMRDPSNGRKVAYRVAIYSHKKYGYIIADGSADFSSATDAQKEYGYICDSNYMIGEAEQSYHIY